MKKRIVSLFLVIAVLCTAVMLTGCKKNGEETQTPEPADKSVAVVLKDAVNKNENLDSMSAVMKMEMNMEADGMTMSIPITANIKAKNLKSDNIISLVDMTMSMFGEDLVMKTYQEGQWAYVVMDGFEYKYNLEDALDETNYANSAKNMLTQIPEDLLRDVKLVKTEDGSQTATVSFPEEKFSEVYSELIDDVLSEAGTEMGEMKISDAVVSVTVADGYVTVYDVAFTMNMTVEDISSTIKAKVTLTYENPGQDVEVTPPEGYQDFEEMNMDDIMF